MLKSLMTESLPLSAEQFKAVSQVVAKFVVRSEVRPFKKDLEFLRELNEQAHAWLVDELRWKISASYDLQKLWRAIYFKARNNCPLAAAASHFNADETDVCFVWENLDAKEKADIQRHCSESEVMLDPIPKQEFNDICVQLEKHATRVASKRLRFIAIYDQGLTLEDLSQELLKHGIATVRGYEHHLTKGGMDLAFILNKGRSSISSSAIDLINFFTHPTRARVVNNADSVERECSSCGERIASGVMKCICGAQGILRQENDFQVTTLSLDTPPVDDVEENLHSLIGFDSRNLTMEKMFVNFLDKETDEKHRKLLMILLDEPCEEFEVYLATRRKYTSTLSLERKRRLACDWLGLDVEASKNYLKNTYRAWTGENRAPKQEHANAVISKQG